MDHSSQLPQLFYTSSNQFRNFNFNLNLSYEYVTF